MSAESAFSDRSQRGRYGCVLLVAAVALFFRLSGLDQQGFWFDETVSVAVAKLPYAEFPQALQQMESSKPPLFHAMIREWMRFGSGDWWLRLSSALCGTAACAVAALLGQELFRNPRGWYLGLFLAISPMHVWYSQELRMYALLTATGFAAMWFHLRFLRSQRWTDLCGYGLFAALSCYAFTYGVFVLGFCALYTLFHRPAVSRTILLKVVAASGLAFLTFVPWMLRILSAASAGQGFQFISKGPVREAAAYSLFNLGFGNTLGATMESLRMHKGAIFQAEPVAAAVLVAGLLLLMAVLATGGVAAWKHHRNAFWFASGGLFCFWATPAVITFLKPEIAYNPRYAILGLAATGALIVSLILPNEPHRRWRLAIVTLFGIMIAWSLANHFFHPAYWREDLRGAARFAEAMDAAPGRVVVCPEHFAGVFGYYYSGSAPWSGLNVDPAFGAGKLSALSDQLNGVDRWMLIYGRTDYGDPGHLVPRWLTDNFTLVERKKLTGLNLFVLMPKGAAAVP